jgi:hypothetical protein
MEISGSAGVSNVGDTTGRRTVVLSRDQRGARRHADGKTGDGSLETDTFGGEAIHVRRLYDRITVAAYLKGAQLVADTKDDIRSLGHNSFSYLPRNRRDLTGISPGLFRVRLRISLRVPEFLSVFSVVYSVFEKEIGATNGEQKCQT